MSAKEGDPPTAVMAESSSAEVAATAGEDVKTNNGATSLPNQSGDSSEPAELDEFGLPMKRYLPQSEGLENEPGSTAVPSMPPPPTVDREQTESILQDAQPSSVESQSGNNSKLDQQQHKSKSVQEKTPNVADHDDPVRRTSVYQPPPSDKIRGTMGEGDLAQAAVQRSYAAPIRGGHGKTRDSVSSVPEVYEYSHQQIVKPKAKSEEENDNDSDGEWQEMPAYAPYDIYDDNNKLVAKERTHDDDEDDGGGGGNGKDNDMVGYGSLGGTGKGYTRVLLDDDAESATSMDENTKYLFNNPGAGTSMAEEDADQRDAMSQLQATKDLLTEGQRIAYVGLTRLELSAMVEDFAAMDPQDKKTKKEVQLATESMKMWAQKMMIRLYSHMDISPAEQIMIEQLSDHGVRPADMTAVLMQNAKVQASRAEKAGEENTQKDEDLEFEQNLSSPTDSNGSFPLSSPGLNEKSDYKTDYRTRGDSDDGRDNGANCNETGVRTPNQVPSDEKLDIDLRWTVLCDLFLVVVADSIYDARSRTLLERLGKDLEIDWIDICRFEKRVTDALELQENAQREKLNEEEHMETRRKMDLRRRYVMMGLATVGGGLVIGLSAGLLAPVIGAGLAAGFTTIGVTGTSGFLAGTAGTAIITSGAAASGSFMGGKAAGRRTGAVKTFEYRPLHNNKRVNLIVTVSGWMTGKVDDVRLPFSTVDPIMGDIYSILWEPEMLTSMGDTINILATEALTQGLQQLLGNTILISLMAALQLPVILSKLAYLIDNPWAVSLDRAWSAGLILADSLIERNLGTRPITLVGYSLGSRVIFSCLLELARKGAFGLVQNVYMFGSPVVVKTDEWVRARTVVSGRFVNGFNRNDWILGYLFRLTSGGIRRVAGLGPIHEIKTIENKDVTDYVAGHMDYRQLMPRLLREVCGWTVNSDEFNEIEDPDPENHRERQRVLINEIEEARKELERKEAAAEGDVASKRKSRFSLFGGRKKKSDKAEWEVYDEAQRNRNIMNLEGERVPGSGKTEDAEGNNHGVLFDVDAIRAELAREAAREQLDQEKQDREKKEKSDNEVSLQPLSSSPSSATLKILPKEIKSTLPPMRLNLAPAPRSGLSAVRGTSTDFTPSTAAPASPLASPGAGVSDARANGPQWPTALSHRTASAESKRCSVSPDYGLRSGGADRPKSTSSHGMGGANRSGSPSSVKSPSTAGFGWGSGSLFGRLGRSSGGGGGGKTSSQSRNNSPGFGPAPRLPATPGTNKSPPIYGGVEADDVLGGDTIEMTFEPDPTPPMLQGKSLDDGGGLAEKTEPVADAVVNPWADDDDEILKGGGDDDIQLTFA